MRPFALTLILVGLPACTPQEAARNTALAADVDAFCESVREDYVYYDSRAEMWPVACGQAREAALTADPGDRAAQLGVIEDLVAALHDPHVNLGTNSDRSPYLVPSSTQYWIEGETVSAVRPHSPAARAGLRIGDRVVAVNGQPLEAAVAARIVPAGTAPTPAQDAWARVSAATGARGTPRFVTVRRDGQGLTLDLSGDIDAPDGVMSARRLADGAAYLRLHNSLGDPDLVSAFDAAMADLADATGFILDLRDTPGGGGTDVAEPVLAHFLPAGTPYQRMRPRHGSPWVDTVAPHEVAVVNAPLVVLVGRWTGSMGEGMAIGLNGTGRAHVIGSDMARLAGAMTRYTLPNTNILYVLSTTDLAHLDGTPRHQWSPPQRVVADNGAGPDLALTAAREWLAARSGVSAP